MSLLLAAARTSIWRSTGPAARRPNAASDMPAWARSARLPRSTRRRSTTSAARAPSPARRETPRQRRGRSSTSRLRSTCRPAAGNGSVRADEAARALAEGDRVQAAMGRGDDPAQHGLLSLGEVRGGRQVQRRAVRGRRRERSPGARVVRHEEGRVGPGEQRSGAWALAHRARGACKRAKGSGAPSGSTRSARWGSPTSGRVTPRAPGRPRIGAPHGSPRTRPSPTTTSTLIRRWPRSTSRSSARRPTRPVCAPPRRTP